MKIKFVGAAARQLSKAQFLMLAQHEPGPQPFVAEDRLANTRRGLVRKGLLMPAATCSASGAAKRNGARFLRLSVEGRRVLEQAMIMRGGVPILASPSIEPKERTIDAAGEREHAEAPGIRGVAADAV